MAKSVGIPDREHSVVSSRAKARRDDRSLGTYTIEASGTSIGPHKQAGHMTAPTFRQKDVAQPLRNGGRPHMTAGLGDAASSINSMNFNQSGK
jgi:hypothetical protein